MSASRAASVVRGAVKSHERGDDMTTKASPADAGCWVDGHWGQYGAARVIEIARDHGWDDAEAIDLATRHLTSMGPSSAPGLADEEFESYISAADDAETWLNDNAAPDGYSFGWHEGEFFLWSDEEWEREDY